MVSIAGNMGHQQSADRWTPTSCLFKNDEVDCTRYRAIMWDKSVIEMVSRECRWVTERYVMDEATYYEVPTSQSVTGSRSEHGSNDV